MVYNNLSFSGVHFFNMVYITDYTEKDIQCQQNFAIIFIQAGVRCIRGALRNVLQRFPTQRYVSKKRLAALRGNPWSCLTESAFLQRTVA